MKETVLKLFKLVLLLHVNVLFGQKVIQENSYYINSKYDTVYCTSITINNTSKEDYLLWLSNKTDIHEYFSKNHGDFTLLQLLNDESVENKQFNILGISFLKLVKSMSVFTANIIYKNRNQWLNNKLRKDIVLVSWKEIPPLIKSAVSRNLQYLYFGNNLTMVFTDYNQK